MTLTEYEKKRNQNVKRNEIVLQSLCLPILAASSCSLLSKRQRSDEQVVGHKNKRGVCEDEGSESEYDQYHDEDIESDEEECDEGVGEEALEQETHTSARSQADSMAPSRTHSKTPRRSSNAMQSGSIRCTRSQSTSLPGPQALESSLRSLLNSNACDGAAQVNSGDNATLVAADTSTPKERNVRKKTMGHGLDNMTVGGTKLTIVVQEGKIRPEHPVQAAKLASECGVALRDHLPIYPHWKDYKDRSKPDPMIKVLGVVASRLDIDVNQDGPSKNACKDIIKKGVRQQRYLLKKKYFNGNSVDQLLSRGPPANVKEEDWYKLIDKWSNPRHMRICEKNKENREQVKLHQRTGSQSYIAKRYSLRGKFNNRDPDAIEFFGECMISSKKGLADLAKQVHDKMESERQRNLKKVKNKSLQLELLLKLSMKSAAQAIFFRTWAFHYHPKSVLHLLQKLDSAKSLRIHCERNEKNLLEYNKDCVIKLLLIKQ